MASHYVRITGRSRSIEARGVCNPHLGRKSEDRENHRHGDHQHTHDDSAKDFVALLKTCAKQKDLRKGASAHSDLLKTELLETNIFVGNALISMYAKCGEFVKAREVLEKLPVRDVVSWSALIAGYAQQGQGQEALKCYESMQDDGVALNAVICISILKACGSIRALDKGEKVHDEILRHGFLKDSIVLGGALVDMYVKCGALAKAEEVIKGLPVRDVISWSALIVGYAQHGCVDEALQSLVEMQRDGLSPDAVTFLCILKACGNVGATEEGKLTHAEIVKQGSLGKSNALGGALVDMYAKCGALAEAEQVLSKLPVRDAVSWSALIAGYVQHDRGKEALNCFDKMRRAGLSPNAITFSCILKACGTLGALDKGKEFHREIAGQGLLRTCVVLGGALVAMYAKCGALTIAREVLQSLSLRNVVSWSALIAGYAQRGHGEEAVECFELMRREGLSPDAVSIVCFLKACGSIGAAKKGEQIHSELKSQGLLGKDIAIGNALVGMYAKCGALEKAQEVLNELPERNVVSWTALVAGYAQQGQVEEALNCFEHMQSDGIAPNEITFVCVLNACSHAGLVEAGQMYFTKMSTVYGMVPDSEHHTCMVDLLGRAGYFDEAVAVIQKMPCSDYLPVWSALLGACRKWQNVSLGRWAFDHAIQLDRADASAYVCMSNLYMAADMKEEANEIEALRLEHGAWKEQGRTWWTDKNGKVHSFSVGDNRHAQSKQIYAKLQDITQKLCQEGYSPSLQWLSKDIPDNAKKDILCAHSEKLAIGCALINTSQQTPIHVVKNMRMCGDCHVVTALISKLEERNICVRDANRMHVFENGKCSCGDYW